MAQETNIELIRELERKIEEGKGDTIELKRARNALLKISTCVPPEILGDIFSWTLVRGDPTSGGDSRFDGFPKGSYNFLLVCHHWFEVASQTPELWSFWGNTFDEWRQWHHRHPQVAPLDLVLKAHAPSPLTSTDYTLKDALRDRATRDTIRQVHLWGFQESPLSSIISLLTPVEEGVQRRSIESIDLRQWGEEDFSDLSDFFARICLPKLRSLLLHGALVLPPLDYLARQTTLLTALSLNVIESPQSPPPTTSQLLSILVSNPSLQSLSLSGSGLPRSDEDGPIRQVTLRHLEKLYLRGDLHRVFRILDRLSFPRLLKFVEVTATNCTVQDASQAFVPYLQLYFRPDRGLQDKLYIGAISSSSYNFASIRVGNEDEASPFWAEFWARLAEDVPEKDIHGLCHNLITPTLRERVRRFNTNHPPDQLEELLVTMPNIETLELSDAVLSEGFLQPNPGGPCAGTKLLPSLRSLRFENLMVEDDDWGPLVAYLGHQTSDGKTISLTLSDDQDPYMCPEVVKQIEDIVGEINYWE